MEPLRLGIAGLEAASRQILSVIHNTPGVELAAGADIRPETLAGFAEEYRAAVFDDVAAMCRSDAVDAVWIATPNLFHAEHTVLAAEHGRHVITEKPMAVTLEEAAGMVTAAARNGVKLLQGHSRVYDPPVRRRREIVSSGRLGRVIHIQTMNYNNRLQRPRIASEVDTARTTPSEDRMHQPFFGLTIVSCERGAIRQSPDGLCVYTRDGREEVACGPRYGRAAELIELRAGLVEERPVFPDGSWGKATLEVCLAMLRSSEERLEHPVPCPF